MWRYLRLETRILQSDLQLNTEQLNIELINRLRIHAILSLFGSQKELGASRRLVNR